MLKTTSIALPVFLLFTAMLSTAAAQEHSVEIIDAAPEAEGVSEEIAKQISSQGFRIKRGSSTVGEIWFRKDLAVDADFKPTPQRLYPFSAGQLVGLLHFRRRGSDFRDQTVSSGWYTLRFGLQPIDGNHVGTSPTRDFFLLVDAEQDELLDNWTEKELHTVSAEAAGSAHPAMLCLQAATDGPEPAMRQDEANDWWILHAVIKGVAKDQPVDIPLDVVVSGHATE